MDDLINIELEMELKALREKLEQLESENRDMLKILDENDLLEEIGLKKPMSAEEQICVKGIEQILEAVKAQIHTDSDVKNFDILNKNLRLIRGHVDSKKKTKPSKVADLLKIVEGKENG